jgi:hypothetical protein
MMLRMALSKVLTAPGKDRIPGVTIVGLNKVRATIHIYPALSEANKYEAGVWKRNHAPKGLVVVRRSLPRLAQMVSS